MMSFLRRRGRRSLLVVLTLCVTTARIVVAQANPRLSVIIVDEGGARVPYATLRVGAGQLLLADDSGSVRVPNLGSGHHVIDVRRLGYRPAVLDFILSSDTLIRAVMVRVATSLEEVRIVARSNSRLAATGVYQRMLDVQHGLYSGGFVTAEEIEARHPYVLTQVLENRVPCVQVSNGVPISCTGCPMTVYVDGARLDPAAVGEGSSGKLYFRQPAGYTGPPVPNEHALDRVVSPGEVAAIEIYPRAASAPAMYQHLNGGCGIIAIWTR